MTTLTDSATVHACHLDIYILADDFKQHAAGLLLSPKHWEVARALDGGATAAALAPRLRMPATTVLAALHQLEERRLVSKVLIPFSGEPAGAEALEKAAHAEASLTMDASAPKPEPQVQQVPAATKIEEGPKAVQEQPAQPSLQTPANNVVEAPAALPMAARARPEKDEAPAGKTVKFSLKGRSAASKPAAVSLRLATGPRKAAPQATNKTDGNSTPEAKQEGKPKASEEKSEGWPMQPVLDALRAKTGGDPMVGQLLAYRVFLRIPSALLTEAGIRSVCLIEPDLVIRNPKLKQALETALLEVTGLSWPKPLAQAA